MDFTGFSASKLILASLYRFSVEAWVWQMDFTIGEECGETPAQGFYKLLQRLLEDIQSH